MWIYMIMLLPALLFAKLAVNAKPYAALTGTYRLFAIFSFFPFAVNAMLRGQVGTDWIIYHVYYYEINNGGRRFSEPLFNLLNRVLYSISTDSALLFAVVSFLTLLFFFLGIFQNSEMVPYSIILFFLTGKYFSSLNQIRQMLAMGIFFFSWKYIRNRQPVRYFVCIFIACMLHGSSIIYVPLYFLYGLPYSSKRLLKMMAVYCLGLPVIMLIAPIFVRFTRYAWYLDSRYAQDNLDLAGFITSLLVALLHLWFLHRQEDKDLPQELRFMTMLSVFTFLLYFLTGSVPQITRIAEGYSVIQILSIPNLIKREGNTWIRRTSLLSVAVLFAGKLIYNVYSTQWWYGVLPYHTFLYGL